jgi:hypothetical protein
MRLDEYMSRDAPGLAELIGKGEVNPTELLALERERAEQVNPLINAIIGPVEEADARSAARWRSRGTRWLPLRSVVTVDGDPVRRWYPSRRLGTPFGAGLAAVAPAARRASRGWHGKPTVYVAGIAEVFMRRGRHRGIGLLPGRLRDAGGCLCPALACGTARVTEREP